MAFDAPPSVWLDDRAARPEAANGLLKALRALFKFAVGRGIAKRNPVAEISKIKTMIDDLRKAGATIAAENGASDLQLMAIFGWTRAEMATLYTRRANRRKLRCR